MSCGYVTQGRRQTPSLERKRAQPTNLHSLRDCSCSQNAMLRVAMKILQSTSLSILMTTLLSSTFRRQPIVLPMRCVVFPRSCCRVAKLSTPRRAPKLLQIPACNSCESLRLMCACEIYDRLRLWCLCGALFCGRISTVTRKPMQVSVDQIASLDSAQTLGQTGRWARCFFDPSTRCSTELIMQ